jgi:hypothetical protein
MRRTAPITAAPTKAATFADLTDEAPPVKVGKLALPVAEYVALAVAFLIGTGTDVVTEANVKTVVFHLGVKMEVVGATELVM